MKQLFEDIFDEIDDEDLVEQPEDIQATNTFPYLFTIYLEDPDRSFPDIIIKKNIKFFNYIFSQTTFIKEFTPVEYSTKVNSCGTPVTYKATDGYTATFNLSGRPTIAQMDRFTKTIIRHMEKTHRYCKAAITFYKGDEYSTVADCFIRRDDDDMKYYYEELNSALALFGFDHTKIGDYAKKHGYIMSAAMPVEKLKDMKGSDGIMFIPDMDFIMETYNFFIYVNDFYTDLPCVIKKDDPGNPEKYKMIMDWTKGKAAIYQQYRRGSNIIHQLLFIDTIMYDGVDHDVTLKTDTGKMSQEYIADFCEHIDEYKAENPVKWKDLVP